MASTLDKVYGKDEWTVYGLWSVDIGDDSVQIGAVVGVPESQRGTAAAAGNADLLADAWYADASDHDQLDRSVADAALAVLQGEARRIFLDLEDIEWTDLRGDE